MTMPHASILARSAAVAAVAVLALVAACSVDVDVANKACPCGDGYTCDTVNDVCVLGAPTTPAPPGPTCADDCKCATDSDCKDPTRSKCSPNKVCVECSKTPDSCAVGYCNDKFQCTAGCKSDPDCQKISPSTPNCLLTLHQCVECVPGSVPCKVAGQTCSPSGVCVESCATGSSCSGGKTCCTKLGLCLDTSNDVLDCGKCDLACDKTNGTPTCSGGMCKWMCASGFAHCGTMNSGCETNIRTDVANCGVCGKNCNTNLNANNPQCVAGTCTFTTCKPGFGDCDGNKANGCECACGAKGQTCCPSPAAPCLDGTGCKGASGKC